MTGWVGFDLDGTLAKYDGWKGADVIGEPIPDMVALAKEHITHGVPIKVFTARVCSQQTEETRTAAEKAITAWCHKHLGTVVPITAEKDYMMMDLYDDRCHRVEINTGRILA